MPGATRSAARRADRSREEPLGAARDHQRQPGAARSSQKLQMVEFIELSLIPGWGQGLKLGSTPRAPEFAPLGLGYYNILASARPGEMPPSGGGGVNNHLLRTTHSCGKANRSYAS